MLLQLAKHWIRKRSTLGLLLGLALLVVCVPALSLLRVPTQVDVTLRATKIVFVPSDPGQRYVLRGVDATAVALQDFTRIALRPAIPANGPAGDSVLGVFASSLGRTDQNSGASLSGTVQVLPGGHREFPTCTLTSSGIEHGEAGLLLDMVVPPRSRVTVSAEGQDEREVGIWVATSGEEQAMATLSANGPFEMDLRECRLAMQGCGTCYVPSGIFSDHLATGNDLVAAEGGGGLLSVSFLAPRPTADLVLVSSLPISNIVLTDPALPDGETRSTLVSEATVSYPGHHRIAPVTLHPPHILVLDGLQGFAIDSLVMAPGERGLVVSTSGRAGEVAAYLPDGRRRDDLRLSLYDSWRDSRLGVALAALAAAAAFASVVLGLVASARDLRQTQ